MSVERITPKDVQKRLTARERLEFLDARNPQDWEAASSKIPRAIRARGEDQEKHVLAELPKDRTLVAYCT